MKTTDKEFKKLVNECWSDESITKLILKYEADIQILLTIKNNLERLLRNNKEFITRHNKTTMVI